MDTSITIKPLSPAYPPLSQRQAAVDQAKTGGTSGRLTEQTLELTPGEARLVEQLKRRDQEVRTHELAHKAVAGQYARGAPSFEYQIGPDGRRYAVGGEVSIDISRENAPRETLRKAQVIRRAAMAPANPSMQDRQVAMQASAMAAEAQHELMLQQQRAEATETQAANGQPPSTTDSATSASGRRALLSIQRVLSGSQEPLQGPFDQFV